MENNIKNMSTQELKDELASRKQPDAVKHEGEIIFNKLVEVLGSPVGKWHVTTENDVEGRSTKDLGIHEGHVADIAAALRKHNFYSLKFEPAVRVPSTKLDTEKGAFKINISFPIDTDTWGSNKAARADAIHRWLGTANTKQIHYLDTGECNYYAASTIFIRRD